MLRLLLIVAMVVQLALPSWACICINDPAHQSVSGDCCCGTQSDQDTDHFCRNSSRGSGGPSDRPVQPTATVDSLCCVCFAPQQAPLQVQWFAADSLPSWLLLDLAFPVEVITLRTEAPPTPLVEITSSPHVRHESLRSMLCVWTI